MENQKIPLLLKDLTFTELISLHDHFDNIIPGFNVTESDYTEVDKKHIAHRDYLRLYIRGKFEKVKKDSGQ